MAAQLACAQRGWARRNPVASSDDALAHRRCRAGCRRVRVFARDGLDLALPGTADIVVTPANSPFYRLRRAP